MIVLHDHRVRFAGITILGCEEVRDHFGGKSLGEEKWASARTEYLGSHMVVSALSFPPASLRALSSPFRSQELPADIHGTRSKPSPWPNQPENGDGIKPTPFGDTYLKISRQQWESTFTTVLSVGPSRVLIFHPQPWGRGRQSASPYRVRLC